MQHAEDFSQPLQIMHFVNISVENESILTWHTLKYFFAGVCS